MEESSINERSHRSQPRISKENDSLTNIDAGYRLPISTTSPQDNFYIAVS